MTKNDQTAPSSSPAENSAISLLQVLPFLLFAGFFLYHWFLIWTFAVDVPYMDEWDHFPRHPLWQWIVTPHNGHRVITTRLFALLLWKWNGWDIATHQLLNFPIFGATLAVFGLVLRYAVRSLPVWILMLALVYCLSPMAHENHLWGYQTQWHLALLFLFAGAYFWFSTTNGQQRWLNPILGSVALVLGIASLSAGIAMAAAMLPLLITFKVKRALTQPEERNAELLQLVIAVAPVVLAIVLHFANHIPDPGAIKTTLPYQRAYWEHFLALASSGSGQLENIHLAQFLGVLFLGLIVAPWLLMWRRAPQRPVPPEMWVLGAITVSLMAALALISLGRASIGAAQALESRYTEFTMLLIPLGLAAWWWVLGSTPRLRSGVFTGAGLVCSLLFVLSFQHFTYYSEQYQKRSAAVTLLKDAYQSDEKFYIPYVYPIPLPAERLREADRLQLSFMKQVR